MGLFSKNKKDIVPEYDKADCEAKKKRMREIFNKSVKEGDTYEILYAYREFLKIKVTIYGVITRLHFFNFSFLEIC